MDEEQLTLNLRREGFTHTYVWQDGPNAAYPDHTHDVATAHIILSGEMTLTTAGATRTYRAGERCDVALAPFIQRAWVQAAAVT